MENQVNSFTFYFDYYNLIDTLPLKDKSILLISITDYVFKDIEPNLTGHNQAIFNTLKAQLNVSKSNSKRRTKRKPKENQKGTEEELDEEPKENKTSISSFKFYISNFKFYKDRELLRGKIEKWLDYKWERNEPYESEVGFKSLLTEIEAKVKKYGEEDVIKLIDECMYKNYKNIIFEKMGENKFSKKGPNPKWVDKNIEIKEASEEEQKEIKKIINKIVRR